MRALAARRQFISDLIDKAFLKETANRSKIYEYWSSQIFGLNLLSYGKNQHSPCLYQLEAGFELSISIKKVFSGFLIFHGETPVESFRLLLKIPDFE